jgi:O-antigen ligase
LLVAIIVISLAVLAFWNFRYTERTTPRRAFSVANVNDFAWRNRIAAWEGGLQMMASKPFLGFGWNEQERVYDHFFRAPRVNESAALQMNDYFTLGTTMGIPAVVCLLVYIGWSLRESGEQPRRTSPQPSRGGGEEENWLRTTCRAGAVVLLVVFWFDGGLFKLATGAVFWILMELGRVVEDRELKVERPEQGFA